MAEPNNSTKTFDDTATSQLGQLDFHHLAQQAITLFSKRYAKAFDTHIDIRKTGIVLKDDYLNFCTRQFDDEMRDRALKVAELQWSVMTGGNGEDVVKLTRKMCIDLCLKGYHSTNIELRDDLKLKLTEIGNFHFDLIDTDHDGFITPQEWASWTRMLGNPETWRGAFAMMDINEDGRIERQEWTDCFIGFFCYIDQERFSHFFGLIH